MTADQARTQARQELADHMKSGLREVGPYIDAYLLQATRTPRNPIVARPVGLHPALAKFAREIVWDVLTSARLDTVDR